MTMKKFNIFKTLLLGFTLTAFASCGEDMVKAEYDHPLQPGALPQVTTDAVEAYGTALKATITMTALDATVEEAGIIVSTDPEMSLTSEGTTVQKVSGVVSGEPITTAVSGLTPDMTYYVKAYAYVGNGGIVFGEVKSVETDNSYVRSTFYACDFTDFTLADVANFSTLSLPNPDEVPGTPVAFTPVNLEGVLGSPIWGFSSSVFHPDLFTTFSGQLTTYLANNLLSYAADFTGKGFPEVTVSGLNIGALFGEAVAGDFNVLISKEPIETAEDLAAATVIGKGVFSTDPTAPTYTFTDVTCSVPIEYDGECYITIHNQSAYSLEGYTDNFGVVIMDFSISSLAPSIE